MIIDLYFINTLMIKNELPHNQLELHKWWKCSKFVLKSEPRNVQLWILLMTQLKSIWFWQIWASEAKYKQEVINGSDKYIEKLVSKG